MLPLLFHLTNCTTITYLYWNRLYIKIALYLFEKRENIVISEIAIIGIFPAGSVWGCFFVSYWAFRDKTLGYSKLSETKVATKVATFISDFVSVAISDWLWES